MRDHNNQFESLHKEVLGCKDQNEHAPTLTKLIGVNDHNEHAPILTKADTKQALLLIVQYVILFSLALFCSLYHMSTLLDGSYIKVI